MAAAADVALLVDGDGLTALAPVSEFAATLRARGAPTVLTPHDGEMRALTGTPPGADRLAAARTVAADTGAVVLLKGPSTVVAAPDGAVRVVANGDQRLATAGSGDVLSGVIGALLAAGLEPVRRRRRRRLDPRRGGEPPPGVRVGGRRPAWRPCPRCSPISGRKPR